jgi:hypothetical protein
MRAKITKECVEDSCRFTIKLQAGWFMLFQEFVFMIIWQFGPLLIIHYLATMKPNDWITIIFSIFFIPIWILGENMVYIFFWNIGGRETIEISLKKLKITTALLGFKFRLIFNLEEISNFRHQSLKNSKRKSIYLFTQYVILGRAFAFEYQGKTYKVGRMLSEDEGLELLIDLQNHLPKSVF